MLSDFPKKHIVCIIRSVPEISTTIMFAEALLISTYNICFCGQIRKTNQIFWLKKKDNKKKQKKQRRQLISSYVLNSTIITFQQLFVFFIFFLFVRLFVVVFFYIAQ